MRFAAGRDSRVKHATCTESKKMKDARCKHPRPGHATGSDSPLRHMTGERFDLKREMESMRKRRGGWRKSRGRPGPARLPWPCTWAG